MELDRIEHLLKNYLEAKTSVADEKILKDYFSQDDIAPHLEAYRPMFRYFAVSKKEQLTKGVSLGKKKNVSKQMYSWLSVAAIALLMVGAYFGKSYHEQQQLEKQKAEYAYQETKKALDLLAENFSRGTEKVAYLNEFVEAKEKIYNKN